MPEESYEERTEQATPRKRQKAKEKGQVARSRDLNSIAGMGGIILVIYFAGEHFVNILADTTAGILGFRYGGDIPEVMRVAFIKAAEVTLPIFMISVAMVMFTSVMQGGFVLRPLRFDTSMLNPIQGFRRMFSLRGLAELIKSLLKFIIGGWVVYYVIKKDLEILPTLMAMEIEHLAETSAILIFKALVIAFMYFLVIGFVSYALERWQYERSLKMTKQEVKEEHKEVEGDPLIKSRIRSIQREIARRRMMQEVPKATVVITNPTHIAVALKYEEKKMIAPKVVAKGAGVVAEKIKEIAMKHDVPIVEDRPLARALFKLELDSFIPEELYVAVAKILAYIYKMRGRL